MTATLRKAPSRSAVAARSKAPASRDAAERRRRALEEARRIRANKSARRNRYREDRTDDPKPLGFHMIRAVSAVLVLFGLVMVLSASSIVSFHQDGSPWEKFIKQVTWAGLGLFCAASAYRFPLKALRPIARFLPFIGAGMMLMAFIPRFGISVNGARAWIHFGSYTFQPSEVMKLCIIVAGAELLSSRAEHLGDLRRVFAPFMGVTLLGVGIAAVQSDIGSCVVMLAIALAMMFLAGMPLIPMGLASTAIGLVGFVYVRMSPDKLSRFTSFLDLEATRSGDGYQVYQALISLSNGGLTGTGIGAGTGKWGYVPLAHSDFIFAIVAEEMGFLGVVGLLALFAFLIYFGFQVALSCRSQFGTLIAGGISAWFLIQMLVNIGGVVGLIPVTGLTLPFISYGGSSMVTSLAAVGLLMNVARQPR